jgi:predicted negative regulator of RcsB-dependent stress response
LTADKGFAEAQYNLGVLLLLSSEKNNKQEAQEWFKLAADQGFAEARFQLGLLLEKGKKKEAHKLYRQAAEGGSKEAVISLIWAHKHQGPVFSIDGTELSKKARKADLAALKQKLEQMNQTPEEREAAEAKAVKEATEAAEKSKTPSPELDGAAAAPPKRSLLDKMAGLKAKVTGGYKPLSSQGDGGYGSFGK